LAARGTPLWRKRADAAIVAYSPLLTDAEFAAMVIPTGSSVSGVVMNLVPVHERLELHDYRAWTLKQPPSPLVTDATA
jgi:hypothetical protein